MIISSKYSKADQGQRNIYISFDITTVLQLSMKVLISLYFKIHGIIILYPLVSTSC